MSVFKFNTITFKPIFSLFYKLSILDILKITFSFLLFRTSDSLLLALVKDKDYFVLTTNVDHCFQKAGFDKSRLFYTQGDYGLFQCSKPCHRGTYDNEETVKKMVVSQGYCIEEGSLTVPEGTQIRCHRAHRTGAPMPTRLHEHEYCRGRQYFRPGRRGGMLRRTSYKSHGRSRGRDVTSQTRCPATTPRHHQIQFLKYAQNACVYINKGR